MKYSMTTIETTEAADKKMQNFASKCLREIIIGKGDDDSEIMKISNWVLRNNNNNIPTEYSQRNKDKLCDIYRWKTSLPPSYLKSK